MGTLQQDLVDLGLKPRVAPAPPVEPAGGAADLDQSLAELGLRRRRRLTPELVKSLGAMEAVGGLLGEEIQRERPGENPLRTAMSRGATLRDLQSMQQAERGTARNVVAAEALSRLTGEPSGVETLPPPLSEDPIRPGLLQRAADIGTRGSSAVAGAIEALVEGRAGEAPAEVAKGLRGERKVRMADVLEAMGVPEGPGIGINIAGGPKLTRKELAPLGLEPRPGLTAELKARVAAERKRKGEPASPATVPPGRVGLNLRDVLGYPLDIVADPLTYLTAGTNRALKLAGGLALSRAGEEALARGVQWGLAAGLGRDAARAGAEASVAAAVDAGAAGLKARGGLKWAGMTIPGTEEAGHAFRRVTRGMADKIRATESGARAIRGAERVIGAFNRDFHVRAFPQYVRDKQHFLNLMKADQMDLRDEIAILFADVPEAADRVAITHAVEAGAIGQLEPRLQRVAEALKLSQDALRQEEIRLGLGESFLEDYMYHTYENYPALRNQFIHGRVSDRLRSNRERVLPTLEEAKALGLKPVSEDARDLFMLRSLASSRGRRAQELLQETAARFGQRDVSLPARIADDLVPLPGRPETVVPRAIAEDLASVGANPLSASRLLRAFDTLQNFWKGSVTSPFPAFYARNAISNVQLSFLDIGLQSANPMRHAEAVAILAGRPGELVTKLGERYSYDEIRRLFRTEALEGAFSGKLALETRGGKLLGDNPVFRAGRKVGEGIESEARMLHFTANIRRGFTPEMAAARTKQFLFDYDNLSAFERGVMRRVFPFYTFYRKNVGLQLKSLATEPGRQAMILKAFATPGDPAEIEGQMRLWPAYVSEGLAVKVGEDRSGQPIILWGTGFPIEDLNRVLPQTRAGQHVLAQAARKTGLALLSPFARFLVEEAAQKDLFLNRPLSEVSQVYDAYGPVIKRLPGPIRRWLGMREFTDRRNVTHYRMNPQALHLIRSFMLSRLYSTAGKQFDQTKDPGTIWLNNLTGLRLGSLDFERQVYPAIRRRADERFRASGRLREQQERLLINQAAKRQEIDSELQARPRPGP